VPQDSLTLESFDCRRSFKNVGFPNIIAICCFSYAARFGCKRLDILGVWASLGCLVAVPPLKRHQRFVVNKDSYGISIGKKDPFPAGISYGCIGSAGVSNSSPTVDFSTGFKVAVAVVRRLIINCSVSKNNSGKEPERRGGLSAYRD